MRISAFRSKYREKLPVDLPTRMEMLGRDNEEIFQEFRTWISFSYTLNNIKLPDWHADAVVLSPEFESFKKKLSGVVYLKENAKKEAGTFIINNKKTFLVENKFDPKCCPSAYSNSTGCVCLSPEQAMYVSQRGGNKTFPSEY